MCVCENKGAMVFLCTNVRDDDDKYVNVEMNFFSSIDKNNTTYTNMGGKKTYVCPFLVAHMSHPLFDPRVTQAVKSRCHG